MVLGPALFVNKSRNHCPYLRADPHSRPNDLVQVQRLWHNSEIEGLSPLQLLRILEEVHMLLEAFEILHFLAQHGLSPKLIMTK